MILFGFEINRAKKTQEDESVKSFAIPQNDDGAVTIQSGAYYGTYVDLDGVVRNEIELITRYRELSIQPEIETAIDEIVNEAIVNDDTSKGVELNLDDLKQPAAIKKKINEEFETILKLLDFSNMGHDLFRRWYVDGRMFYHIIVDEANTSKGIRELRYIDPRRIRKIREIQKAKEAGTGTEIVKSVREYYIYNERGVVGAPTNLGMKIAVDSVVNINSGLMDSKRSMVLSYLHKAIKPFNNLRMVEDATVIYRLSRAPERRIFYVDVGNMSTVKAEQYLKDIMTKYRNKLVYDSCLDMKTLVPLLDGRTLTITEIQKEFEEGKQLWIYSCDPKTGNFAPGLVTSAGVTRFDEKVMRLTLDNGKTITCTYDHKFPVWNKGKVEAKDLAIGDSMFPFYIREKTITSKSKSTYQQIFENEQKKWLYTHRLVSDWKDSIGMFNEYVFNEENIDNTKKTVHHNNYNRYDNTPNNLTRMSRNDHFEYHKQHNSFAGKIGGKATSQKRKEEGIPFFPVRPSKEILIESGKKLAAKKLGFQAWTDEEKKNHNIKNNRKIVERLKNDLEFNEKFRKAISDGWKEESRNAAAERGRKTATKLHKIKKCNVCEIETTVGNIKRWHNENCKKYNNHKIINIEYLDERIDVGTLGIDKYEVYHDFHTFALDAGIYTCNSTGEVKDDRKHLSMLEDFYLPRREGCFSLSTKIKLLDGRDIELGQLIVEHKMGKNNWVYSVSPEGEVVPGKISWAGVTRNEAEVLDIHLDNGEVVTATPDHKFILRNGIKIEAKDLHVGSSLMPLNTRNKHITHNRNGEYLQIQDNKTSEWKFAHRMVAENIHGKKKINEVVHHVDFTRCNNNPENLQYMDGREHFLYHSKMGTRSWANGNVEEHKKNLSESLLRFYYETEKGRERRQQISNFNRECEEIWKGFAKGRQKIKENRARDREILTKEEYLAKWSKGLSIEASRKGTEVWKKTIEFDRKNLTKEEFFEKHGKAKSTTLIKKYRASKSHIDLSQIQKVLETCLKNNVDCKNEVFVEEIAKIYPDINNIKRFRTLLRHNGYNTITEFIHRSFGDEYVSLKRNVSLEKKSNHTVVKIVHRTDRMDVGTLTIDENHEYHDYHNFALSSGIFVMNSRGTEITTLPGGMNLGELEDVKYFEKKLYKALGVPISRLEPSQGFSLGRTTEIQRDELKFNKFIGRLRNKFASIFDDLLRVQLILKKVCTEEEWKEFKEDVWYDFKQDNNFSELKESELLTNRLSLLAVVDPFVGRYYSKEWVRKNVLKQDEKDMEEIDEQIANEVQDATPAVDSMVNQIDPMTGQPIQPASLDQMNGQQDPNAVPEPEQMPSKFSLPTNSIVTS